MWHIRKKKQIWFVKVRGSYLPSTRQGWLSYIPYVSYLIAVPAALWRSFEDRPLEILAVFVLAYLAGFFAMHNFAARHSK